MNEDGIPYIYQKDKDTSLVGWNRNLYFTIHTIRTHPWSENP
jgi:hypothetical protein